MTGPMARGPAFRPERIRIQLVGVPPNWANERMHRMAEASAKRDWKEIVSLVGTGLRKAEGWPAAKLGDVRGVTFHLFRNRMLDHDGAYNSIKPLLDGLKRKGSDGLGAELIWEDNPRHLPAEKLHVVQQQVSGKELTIILVEREIEHEMADAPGPSNTRNAHRAGRLPDTRTGGSDRVSDLGGAAGAEPLLTTRKKLTRQRSYQGPKRNG